MQVSSPGRAELAWVSNPCTKWVKKGEEEGFCTKNSPPSFKEARAHGTHGFYSP